MKEIIPDIKKFELHINTEVPFPLTTMVYYDFNKNEPVNIKFVKFQDKEMSEADWKCNNKRHYNGKFALNRIRYFNDRLPPGVKPFSMYIYPCTNCGLIYKAQFITYKKDIEEYAKVGDGLALAVLDTSVGPLETDPKTNEKLETATVHPLRRVLIEGQ